MSPKTADTSIAFENFWSKSWTYDWHIYVLSGNWVTNEDKVLKSTKFWDINNPTKTSAAINLIAIDLIINIFLPDNAACLGLSQARLVMYYSSYYIVEV